MSKDITFRNPINNSRYTKALFYETTGEDKSNVVYTLKDDDHEGFKSLRRLYLEEDDLTEYLFASQHLDGWDHWQMLCASSWFKPYIEKWRNELYTRANARALQVIMKQVVEGDIQAAKFILSHFFKQDNNKPNKRGRPSKEEVSKAAHEAAQDGNQVKIDYERLIGNGDS